MSKLSDLYKARKENHIHFFFGDDAEIHGEVIDFKGYKDDDHVIVITNNVRYWRNKDVFVLIVDNNKVVYLKDWQVEAIKNWDLGQNSYAVKLDRRYFKTYTMSFKFDDVCFAKEDTFDDLVAVAKSQDLNKDHHWKLGHYDCL